MFGADLGEPGGVLVEQFGAAEQQLQAPQGAAARIGAGVLTVVPGDQTLYGLRPALPEVGAAQAAHRWVMAATACRGGTIGAPVP